MVWLYTLLKRVYVNIPWIAIALVAMDPEPWNSPGYANHHAGLKRVGLVLALPGFIGLRLTLFGVQPGSLGLPLTLFT